MSLSSLIVQRELASIREVEEALARQVLYGGDLVTNLLEVTHVEEARITGVLAESYGRKAAPAGELPPPSTEAKALVPRELCVQHGMVPLSVGEDGLVVAVHEPMDAEAEEELRFALSVTLSQRIAPYVRVQQAIAREYNVLLERRIERLLLRLAGTDAGGSSIPRGPPVVAQPPRPLSELPRVMLRSSEEPGVDGAVERTAGAPGPKLSARVVYSHMDSRGLPQIVTEQRRGEDVPPPTVIHGQRRSAPPEPAPTKTRVKKPRRRRGPMVADAAEKEMEGAEDRDTILELLFEYCRQFFDYTALFIVHGDLAEGWDAFGDGASRDRVLDVGVPLDVSSLLSTARTSGRVLHAMPTLGGLDGVWLNQLELHGDTALVIAPVVVGKRAVAMLIGDGGPAGVEPSTVDQTAWICGLAGAAFQRIIVRRKLVGYQRSDKNLDLRVDRGHVSPKSVPVAPRTTSLDVPAPPAMPEAAAVEEPLPLTARSGPPPKPLEPHDVVEIPKAPPVPDPPTPSQDGPLLGDARPLSTVGEIVAMPIIELAGSDSPAGSASDPIVWEANPYDSVPLPPRDLPGRTLSPATLDAAPAPATAPTPALAPAPESIPVSIPISLDLSISMAEPAVALATDVPVAPDPDPPLRAVSATKPSPGAGPVHSVDVTPVAAPAAAPPRAAKPPPRVDTFGDYGPMVERFVTRSDEKAHAELLRAGKDAMPAIMHGFPGPLEVDASKLDHHPLPRATECGPLLSLIAAQRKVALPFVVDVAAGPRPDLRAWATLLLVELAYPEAAAPVVARLFDEDARVRNAAQTAARALADHHAAMVHERISEIALDASLPSTRRRIATSALGEIRNAITVPSLIHGVADPDPDIASAAHKALVLTTRHDVGVDPKKWTAFWQTTGHKHRVEWLIDALTLDRADLTRAAGEELALLTHDSFGFSSAGSTKERERAQIRYRAWWANDGRVRFRRG